MHDIYFGKHNNQCSMSQEPDNENFWVNLMAKFKLQVCPKTAGTKFGNNLSVNKEFLMMPLADLTTENVLKTLKELPPMKDTFLSREGQDTILL